MKLQGQLNALTVKDMKSILSQMEDSDVLLTNSISFAKPNDKEWFMWQPLGHVNFESNQLEPLKPIETVDLSSFESKPEDKHS